MSKMMHKVGDKVFFDNFEGYRQAQEEDHDPDDFELIDEVGEITAVIEESDYPYHVKFENGHNLALAETEVRPLVMDNV